MKIQAINTCPTKNTHRSHPVSFAGITPKLSNKFLPVKHIACDCFNILKQSSIYIVKQPLRLVACLMEQLIWVIQAPLELAQDITSKMTTKYPHPKLNTIWTKTINALEKAGEACGDFADMII